MQPGMPKTNEQPSRWWDLIAAILLIAALSIAADRLVSTNWTNHLEITQTLAAFGVITGLLLGQSRFSVHFSIITATIYGLFLIVWRLGMTIELELLWTERLSILLNRVGVVIYQLLQREAVQDSILFILAMCALFWILGVSAGFVLMRSGNAWQAVIPSGITILSIHIFDNYISNRTWYLAAYLFFALILVARMAFLKQKRKWQQNQTAIPAHINTDIIRFTIYTTLVILLLAWTIPAAANVLPAVQRAWEPVRSAWHEARDEFEFAFASLRSNVAFVSEYYGISTSLGRGTALTDALVFTAKAPVNLPPSCRLYWRGRVYDQYENGSWTSEIQKTSRFDFEEDDLLTPEFTSRWLGTFRITTSTQMSILFSPAQPLWVNRSGEVIYTEISNNQIDIAGFTALPLLQSGQEYRVQSALTYTSIEMLRAAGTEYPDWIQEYYLSLPESITTRTLQLAQEITLGLETPYDKAAAITDYLRENITYVETIEDDIPLSQERIDWFLFDYQKGFCNYYSTAEVILLRAIGIPARWAVGYAQGERIADEQEIPGTFLESGAYVVRQRHTHAWVEVYFPDIGWVEFEPTSSEPEIARLESLPQEEQDSDEPETSFRDIDQERYQSELDRLREERDLYIDLDDGYRQISILYWILPVFVVLILSFIVWRNRKHINWQPTPIMIEAGFKRAGLPTPKMIKNWSLRSMLTPLAKTYHEINMSLERLGNAPGITETPQERAETLASLLPICAEDARELTREYQKEIYGDQSANLVITLSASKQIKRASIKELMVSGFKKIRNPFDRLRKH